MNLDNYITKVAVNLKQLTKAYNKLVKPRRVKTSNLLGNDISQAMRMSGFSGKAHANAVSFPQGRKMNKALYKEGIPKEELQIYPSKSKLKGTDYKQGFISTKGDIASEMSRGDIRESLKEMAEHGYKTKASFRLTQPKAKEMVGKSMGLHEAAELRAGAEKTVQGGFLSHLGPRPPLQDLTIANTLTGKGSNQASEFIKNMRIPEVKIMEYSFPQLKRLDLINKRTNRREKKYIQSLMEYKG